MLFLLRGVSRPYFRRHWVITLLTVSGVALGVGVYVAIELSSSTLRVSMRETVDRVAGRTQLEVSAGEGGVPDIILDRLRAVPGVAAAQPIVEAVVAPRDLPGESSLMVLGIDLLGDRQVRDWSFEDDQDVLDDPLIFLAQPDSICVTQEFATRHRLGLEDRITLETGHGFRPFTIRGLIRPQGPATAFGGNIVLMDLYAAQFAFGRGRQLDRVDVALTPSTSLEGARRRIVAALGSGYQVDTPARRGAQMESLIANFGTTLALSSWQAVVIAVFLIFNVFAVAATRRRREIGILRSLGVTRRQILTLFLIEGAILGTIGSVVGACAGLLLAGSITRFIIRLTEVAYGVTHSAPVVLWDVRVLAVGLLLGGVSAVTAAFVPARAAARVAPVEALAKGRFLRSTEAQDRVQLILGIAVAAATAAVIVVAAPRSLNWATCGLLLINVSALLLAPTLVRWFVRLERPLLEHVFGAEGRIAADTLAQAPRRTSATVLALMVSVGFVLSLAGTAHAFRRSYDVWLDGVINADFYLTASDRFFSKAFHVPPEFETMVAGLPGVRWVEPFRAIHLDMGGRRPLLASLPLEKTYRRMDPPVVTGDPAALRARVPRGEGVAVSDNFARLYRVGVGDRVSLPSPTGAVVLPVVAILADYSSDHGTIYLDRRVYVARWRDASIDTLDVLLEPGADRKAVASAIRERLAGRTDRLFVMTSAEFKARIGALLDQFFALSWIQLAIALLVAVLGITNTLVISVVERRRELGILKALGADRRQVRRMILLEAMAIALCGGCLGYALGTYLIHYSLDAITANGTGWSLPYAFPWDIAAGLAPLLAAVTAAAALYPARLALRVSPAEALEFE